MSTRPPQKNGSSLKRISASYVAERFLKQQQVWQAGPAQWRCVCPFHKGAENASQFILNANGNWTCFTCGASGGMRKLLSRLTNVPIGKIDDLIASLPAARSELGKRLPAYKFRHGIEKPPLPESDIVLYKRNCPVYLLTRGFSEAALYKYEIGYDLSSNRIVIPVRDLACRLRGVTRRLDYQTNGPKYFHEWFDKNKLLYGAHLWAKTPIRDGTLYVTEGQLDTVRLFELGMSSVGVFGSNISDEQAALLRHLKFNKLVLAYDNDEAGLMATEQTLSKLTRTTMGRFTYIARYPTKDPGELSRAEDMSCVHWTKTRVHEYWKKYLKL